MLPGALLPDKAVPGPHIHQGHLDAEPEENNGDQGTERDGGAGGLGPDEQVEDEDDGEQETREQNGCDDHVLAPALAAKGLVHTRREVTRKQTGKHKEADPEADEAAAVAGVEDAQCAQKHESDGHEEQLHSGTNQRGEQVAVGRRAEDVGVQEFPARDVLEGFVVAIESIAKIIGANLLFQKPRYFLGSRGGLGPALGFHVGGSGLVSPDIGSDGLGDHHEHDAGQDAADDERVDNGQPVDLVAILLVDKVEIPPPVPLDRGVLAEVNRVTVGDGKLRIVIIGVIVLDIVR